MKRILFISLVAVLLSACGPNEKHVVANYYLYSTDVGNSLGYKVGENSYLGLITRVKEITHSDHFIAVKGIRQKNGLMDSCATYYIISVYSFSTYQPDSGIIGPLEREAFDSKCQQLGLPVSRK